MEYHAQPLPQGALLLTLRERLDETARVAARPKRTGWRGDLGDNLDLLRSTLHRHFRRDEDERLNEAFLGTYPRFEPRLRDLLSEHGVLMDRLDSLRSRVRDLPRADGPARQRLGRDVGTFLVELERHEAAERDLMLTAQSTDLGAGD